jgi:hypothetical protein
MHNHAHRSIFISLCLGVGLAACTDPPPPPDGGAPVSTAAQATTTPMVVQPPTSPPALCNGTFSDGTSISVKSPAWLADVPGQKSLCDFHTFAWNQFLYLVLASMPPSIPSSRDRGRTIRWWDRCGRSAAWARRRTSG